MIEFVGRSERGTYPGDDLFGPAQHRLAHGIGVAAAVSYTHLRAHETVLDIVCRLLLEKQHHTQQTVLVLFFRFIFPKIHYTFLYHSSSPHTST